MPKLARHFKSKIHSASMLANILSRSPRKRAVFTNGCFDLIHKGHVSYLQRARDLGDLLIVALNSDASVRRLKGPSRPLNSLRDRLEVMAALESVDFVTWFTADTPLSVIKALRPKILVKGGDWKLNQIVGAAEVQSWGGHVYSLQFVRGRSTTKIIERARQ